MEQKKRKLLPIVAAAAQGLFCLGAGIGVVFWYGALARATGHAPDRWLLTLAGLLLAGIGFSLLVSAIRRDIAVEVFSLGLVTACALAGTDVFFVIERSIPVVYLLDAVTESLFVTLWVFAIRDLRPARRSALDLPPSTPPATAVETDSTTRGADGTG